MKEHLRSTIDLLRKKVEDNLKLIRNNEALIRETLENEPVSTQRSSKLQEKFNENKFLLEENNDTINLQVSMIKYLEKYKKSDNIQVKVMHTPDENIDYFEKTISGEIDFNEDHPFFNDADFYNRLMDYYLQEEAYEKCIELKKYKIE